MDTQYKADGRLGVSLPIAHPPDSRFGAAEIADLVTGARCVRKTLDHPKRAATSARLLQKTLVQ